MPSSAKPECADGVLTISSFGEDGDEQVWASVSKVSFTGFPVAALDFYDDLEMDNTRSFWEANKAVYADSVAAPMMALTETLAPEFGAAKAFRPYRDG